MLLKTEKDVNVCLSRASLPTPRSSSKNTLALRKSYDRLATVCSLTVITRRISRIAAVGKIASSAPGVSIHGPRSSPCHLADYVGQHVFLPCQEMVVTDGRFLCRRRDRSSFRRDLHSDGHCVHGCTDDS